MRGMLAAAVACVCISVAAAPAVPTKVVEAAGLRSIAGWLKAQGAEGFLGADVADAIGIPHSADVELIAARQRGFRDEQVLRIAQVIDGDYIVFMVQGPGEVYFYLSTVREGLRKALVSIPGQEGVAPLEPAEAESNFRREVLYWEDKVKR
jgi:fructose-1,6-bisphosphatase/sedoheptulose 1,7-bisphosphatase-like protein